MKETVLRTEGSSESQPTAPSKLRLNRILAPTDFSSRSAAAIDYAMQLGRSLGAQVTLLHLVPEPSLDYTMGGMPSEKWEELTAKAETKLDQELAEVKRAYEGVEVDSLLRASLGLREGIVGVVKEISADLLVLSTHGYTGWRHLLFSSDAEKMIHEAPCPVLVVR
jgi:universal stress protein A